MSQRLNCWQFKNCGREEGGILAECIGVCPVSTSMKHDGTNGGKAAGRVCWQLPKSSPPSLTTCATRGTSCQQCAFYKRVHHEGIDLPAPATPTVGDAPKLPAEAEPN